MIANWAELSLLLFFLSLLRLGLITPGTGSVDQAGLELRDTPASASPVLGSKAWATMTSLQNITI